MFGYCLICLLITLNAHEGETQIVTSNDLIERTQKVIGKILDIVPEKESDYSDGTSDYVPNNSNNGTSPNDTSDNLIIDVDNPTTNTCKSFCPMNVQHCNNSEKICTCSESLYNDSKPCIVFSISIVFVNLSTIYDCENYEHYCNQFQSAVNNSVTTRMNKRLSSNSGFIHLTVVTLRYANHHLGVDGKGVEVLVEIFATSSEAKMEIKETLDNYRFKCNKGAACFGIPSQILVIDNDFGNDEVAFTMQPTTPKITTLKLAFTTLPTNTHITTQQLTLASRCLTEPHLCSLHRNTVCEDVNDNDSISYRCICSKFSSPLKENHSFQVVGGEIFRCSVCYKENLCKNSGICVEDKCICPWTHMGEFCDNPLPMALVIFTTLLGALTLMIFAVLVYSIWSAKKGSTFMNPSDESSSLRTFRSGTSTSIM